MITGILEESLLKITQSAFTDSITTAWSGPQGRCSGGKLLQDPQTDFHQ